MKTNIPKTILLLIFCLAICYNAKANNLPNDTQKSLFTHLQNEGFNQVLLEVDLQKLLNKRPPKNEREKKASITFTNAKGGHLSLKTKVSLRGKFRRVKCDFPPLKLNFSKKQLKEIGLRSTFDKYKLVTHCIADEEGKQALLKEFATYKMYNEITPESFRVHFLEVVYQDIHNTAHKIKQFAFLIEENDELADRLGGKLIIRYGLKPEKFTPSSFNNTMVFSYMIGNLDWNIRRHKNLKFVKVSDQEKLILVPYDFDLCGLVAPNYAVLNSNFNQRSLDERFCIGKFESEVDMQKTLTKFKSLRGNFTNCYTKLPNLNRRHTKKMSRYLDTFYNLLDDETEIATIFLAGKYTP